MSDMPGAVAVSTSLFGGRGAVAWEQVVDLFAAVALCGMIGFERELRRKSAGLRTHATVGLAATLIMIVSKYGFADVLGEHVTLDPSRVAAQIVTGIGFVGAGLIFVRQDAVRGLTTAASVWLSAAVGMACGAHLLPIAAVTAAAYLLLSVVLFALESHLPRHADDLLRIRVTYRARSGVLRELIHRCVERGLVIVELRTDSADSDDLPVSIDLGLRGMTPMSEVLGDLLQVPGVVAVSGDRDDRE